MTETNDEKHLIPPETIPVINYIPEKDAPLISEGLKFSEQRVDLRDPKVGKQEKLNSIFQINATGRQLGRYDLKDQETMERETAQFTISLLGFLPSNLHDKFWILDDNRPIGNDPKLTKVFYASDEVADYLVSNKSSDKKIQEVSRSFFWEKKDRDAAVALLSPQEQIKYRSLRARLLQDAINQLENKEKPDDKDEVTRAHELTHVSTEQEWNGLLHDTSLLYKNVREYIKKSSKGKRIFNETLTKLKGVQTIYEYIEACEETESIAHELVGGSTVFDTTKPLPHVYLNQRLSDLLNLYQKISSGKGKSADLGIDFLLRTGNMKIQGNIINAFHEVGTLFLLFPDRMKPEMPQAGAASTPADFIADSQDTPIREDILTRMEEILNDEEYAKKLFIEGADKVQTLLPHLIRSFDTEVSSAFQNFPDVPQDILDLHGKIKQKIEKTIKS